MPTTDTALNPCPKCLQNTATSESIGDNSRFYCTSPDCDFELQQQKQDMHSAREKLQSIKDSLFNK